MVGFHFPAKSTLFLIAIICGAVLPVSAQQPDTLFSLKSPFEESSGNFGNSVSDAGDVNMDGKADVIVGAPLEDPGISPSNAGRTYVFSGATGDTLFSLKSPFERSSGQFGVSVSGTGDVNMDGKADIIVGAIFEDPGSSPFLAGRAYVLGLPAPADLVNINDKIGVEFQLPFFNFTLNQFSFEVKIINNSAMTLFSPLFVEFETIDPLSVTVDNPDRGGNTN